MDDPRIKIFYSWQSDLPPKSNRYFSQDALSKTVKALNKENVDLEVELDRDTKNLPGSPNIINAILTKISESRVFVADISLINSNSSESSRKTPNPNVLFELGYAVAKLGWAQVILVFNLHSGELSDLPFDIKQHRVLSYIFDGQENKNDKLEGLSETLRVAINACLDWQPMATATLTEKEIKELQFRRDTELLRKLLQTLHMGTVDSFFEYADSAIVYGEIFYFFENFHAIVRGSDFHFYDKKLYNLVLGFYTSLSTSLDIGGQYTNPGQGKLYSFTNDGEPDFEEAISNFYSSVDIARNTFQELLRYIQEKYLDIDIRETSKIAFFEHQSFDQSLRNKGLID